MRLTSAKCPNCGVDIKVNKDEENRYLNFSYIVLIKLPPH